MLVVTSDESGMGKSFLVEKCGARLSTHLESHYQVSMQQSLKKNPVITIPVHGTTVNIDAIVDRLLKFEEKPNAKFPRLYHIDITTMVFAKKICNT